MRRGLTRVAAAFVTAGVLLLGTALPATAATGGDDLWYAGAFHLQDAWDAGYTGKGVTVAVIDTRINPDVSELQGADVTVHEPAFCGDADGNAVPATSTGADAVHGTNVVTYVVGTGKATGGAAGVIGSAPDAKVIFYAAAVPTAESTQEFAVGVSDCPPLAGDAPVGVGPAIDQAIDDGADIISTSLGGIPDADTVAAIARAENAGIVILAALPNKAGEVTWPSDANGVVAVQAIGADGAAERTDGAANSFDKVTVSNAGLDMRIQTFGSDGVWGVPGTADGTSIATPITAGFLADVLQKYPTATANQLIQTLIHNTGAGNPDLTVDDTYGYGIASLTTMLTKDPTDYDDVNPLVVDDPDVYPAASALGVGAGTATPKVTPTAPSTSTDAESSGGISTPIVVGIVIVALLVIAGIITLIVILGRRRNGATPPTDHVQTGA